ncbi:MAG: heavy metal translocating P-type ATPase, partial [Chloroflexota bacterium]|nr:heavy metal translocating P-type ATPase [Chloroflexota bacterium]
MTHAGHGSADEHAHAGHMDRALHSVHQKDAGGHAGHVDHSGHEELFRKRFWVSLLLSIPVLLYTPMLQMWFGFRMPEFPGSHWIAPLFSVIVFLYGGIPFIQMAIPEIRSRQP